MNPVAVAEEAVGAGASQKVGELANLLDIVGRLRPKTILEIGSMNGGTLRAWRAVAPDATIISVSLTDGPWGGGQVPEGLADHHIDADSHDQQTLTRLLEILDGKPVDFLFIDADHSYLGVRQDFTMYGWLVRHGGAIAFHDILMHPPGMGVGVQELWGELERRYETEEFTQPEVMQGFSWVWGGIGVVYP